MDAISAETGLECGFGNYAVTVVPHFPLQLANGENISLKLWFPSDSCKDTPFQDSKAFLQFKPVDCKPMTKYPAILEHVPYRKTDACLARDYPRHTWMSSHGYIVIRSDLRGSGESEGVYFDEYEEQELNDACAIINWVSNQAFSNGRVGMYGKSWGGFNGLQVSFKQPEALKSVISLYSTDDRYATDVHYMGGCILGCDMIGWSAEMVKRNGKPPNPGIISDWKDVWLKRLRKQGPFVDTWLAHQTRDEYWKRGSICEDPKRIKAAVLAIGGFNDAYRNPVFRMAESIPEFRGIVGPWCHDWPDCNRPGPHIEYMLECKAWWDKHLKEINNNAMDVPLLRLYLQDAIAPAGSPPKIRPGRWVKMNSHHTDHTQIIIPDNVSGKLHQGPEYPSLAKATRVAPFSAVCGLATGDFCSFGDDDNHGDQRISDAHSLHWTSDVLHENINILGIPNLQCTLSSDKDEACIAARLVDVFPDGRSTLVSYGVLNLSHREGHSVDDIKPLVPNEECKVNVELTATSYCVPKGHRMRLAVSPTYWPMIWPSRDKASLNILTGDDKNGGVSTSLHLPIFPESEIPHDSEAVMKTATNPKMGPPLPAESLRAPSYNRFFTCGISSPQYTYKIEVDSGRNHLKQVDTIIDDRMVSTFSIEEDKPLSAEALVEGCTTIECPNIGKGIVTTITIKNRMWSDYDNFYTECTMSACLGNEEIYANTSKKTHARFHV